MGSIVVGGVRQNSISGVLASFPAALFDGVPLKSIQYNLNPFSRDRCAVCPFKKHPLRKVAVDLLGRNDWIVFGVDHNDVMVPRES